MHLWLTVAMEDGRKGEKKKIKEMLFSNFKSFMTRHTGTAGEKGLPGETPVPSIYI